ncbi:hypothetical protein DPMN_165595 [Dreissena polymorpha]|uniref:Uncharacterized protein n=1 Tax=Dreissena polymorpha TaxID=45954 RepID=A0A9D4EX53_DREPO|nr:hypothetical protein DPMN_165595 [Dreissena polymorpha]
METGASSGEQSPPYSDNAVADWNWTTHLNTETSADLCALVEDKEIAARAVAFVVNSTRKGIVPLCADVANLMRSKQCLERKLQLIRRENATFRSSMSGGSVPSHSMSPTPPSLSLYAEQCIKSLQEHSLQKQDHFRSSSRCSNSSSTYSYSPKLESGRSTVYTFSPRADNPRVGALRPQGVQLSPASSIESRKHSPRFMRSAFHESHGQENASTRVERKSTDETDDIGADIDLTIDIVKDFSSEIFNNIEKLNKRTSIAAEDAKSGDAGSDNKGGTSQSNTSLHFENETETESVTRDASMRNKKAIVKEDLKGDSVAMSADSKPGATSGCTGARAPAEMTLLERRRVSLPEITAMPNMRAIKIRPKQSKEIQCSLDQTSGDQSLEERFMKSVRLNARLEDELRAARRQIEQLRSALADVQNNDSLTKSYGRADDERGLYDNGYYTSSNRTSRTGSEHERISLFQKPSGGREVEAVGPGPGALPQCKCKGCQDALGSDEDLVLFSDLSVEESKRYPVNNKLDVKLNDHVTVKGGHSGYIRYIGHVDNADQSHTVLVGLELETAGN